MTDSANQDTLAANPQLGRDDPAPDFSGLKSTLPEDLRNEPALTPFTSFEGMARSLVDAQKMVGKRIGDASPEELGRYYEQHGRPKTPEGYQFGLSEGAVDEAPRRLENEARRWFFDAGLSQRQAEELHDRWNTFASAQQEENKQLLKESWTQAENALRREWGRVYDRKVAAASRAVRELGGEDLGTFLDDTGLGNDPRMIRAFARIAEQIGEDS